MSDARRQILDRVAAGDLSPEQAAEELARLDDSDDRASTERADNDPPAPRSEPSAATRRDSGDSSFSWTYRTGDSDPAEGKRVKVVANASAVRVIADHDVDTVDVEGEGHIITNEGDTTVVSINNVESSWIDEDGDESDIGRGVVVIGTKRGTKKFRLSGLTSGKARRVTVRVNPDVPLEIDVSAGSASVAGLRAPMVTHVSAAKLDVEDFRGEMSGSVNAGKLVARGVFVGESRLSADASSVMVDLEPGSDVVIGAELQLSSLHIGQERRPHPESGENKFFVGHGRGVFHVRGSMSKVHLDVVDD